jgi:hypothetical protein
VSGPPVKVLACDDQALDRVQAVVLAYRTGLVTT